MKYFSRRAVKPGDLNPAYRLFGGTLLAWIDEEAAIYASCKMGPGKLLVTKYMSEIDFVSSAACGDILEFGIEVVSTGKTSLTICCVVRNKVNRQVIIVVDRIVFVCVDEMGTPTPHHIKAEKESEVLEMA
ncbi:MULTISPECIES: hotdog domain-containing protein [Gammaproteobacteria]|uniref:acyl-CoA thioesterase n=1 Tax=Gammaproteobacteria TaxID=1236 RepID=UPI001ADC058C|nr:MULTISPECIES: hotdog domain-containing protein [Gammaproteobacteria]MBO9481674.1 acyl-CoA thioesterase [Salinisphaera sp. G21_0]MBO9493161.1 acyl-CoA thioesterase [Thalassotalea sp. G20_0]